MKLFHLSDLHLGKRLNEYSLLEDQRHILDALLDLTGRERPDAVLIAGDVYDKPVPPAEAVELLDSFLVRLTALGAQVLLIAGNHDSPERLAFGGRLMAAEGVHVAPVYDGTVRPVVLTDEYGPVYFYLLPFLKPAHVRRFFPEEETGSYTAALRAAVGAMGVDFAARNVLVTHQFVTGAHTCDSEEHTIGGTDGVDAAVFDGFDYVALGHLHNPQQVGRPEVRYCGTPLKYSFSEANCPKSVTVVELGEKGTVSLSTLPLTPRRELRELRGRYEALTLRSFYAGTSLPEDYLHITLTDEEDIPDAVGKLRVIYPYLMKLDYDNTRTRSMAGPLELGGSARRSPMELFEALYERQNNQPMTAEMHDFLSGLMGEIWEETL